MDQGLSSSKPEHFDLRAIRQAAGGESLFPSSRLPLSCIRPVRISSKSGIHQEKVQAHRKVRYADRVGDTNTPSSKKHPESDLSMLIRSIRVIRRSISSSVPLLTSAMLQRRSRPTAGPNSHIRQRRSVYILLMCFANAIIFSTMFSGHEHRGITARLREVTETIRSASITT